MFSKRKVTYTKDGKPKTELVSVVKHEITERHTISASSGTELVFFSPTLRTGHTRLNYECGSQNLFKTNAGFIYLVAFDIHDVDGGPIADEAVATVAYSARQIALWKSLNGASIVHVHNEYETHIHNSTRYFEPPPAIINSTTTGLVQFSTQRKAEGYGYGQNGKFIDTTNSFLVKVRLRTAFASSTYGMVIDCRALTERLTDTRN